MLIESTLDLNKDDELFVQIILWISIYAIEYLCYKIYLLRIKNTIRLDIEKVLYRLFLKKIFT